jgi:SAM-dependent methyltransferase
MGNEIEIQTQKDRAIWDHCSRQYEKRIVGGHPDVHAYETFEETVVDHLLAHLVRCEIGQLSVIDLGCGSGRLLLRLGAQTTGPEKADAEAGVLLEAARQNHPGLAWVPSLEGRLHSITGIDFSRSMLELAREKLAAAGLHHHVDFEYIRLLYGSAFAPVTRAPGTFPLVVCLVNSIGVMQGVEGARKLFQAIFRIVQREGVGLISCYRRENVRSHGLGQYESTMDVSGPPIWLESDRYDLKKDRFVPLAYRRYDESADGIEAAVFDADGRLKKERHFLRRIPSLVEKAVESGEIRTHQGYESRWYSEDEIRALTAEFWGEAGWHMPGAALDPLRARAAQLAWCDPTGQARQWIEQLTGRR